MKTIGISKKIDQLGRFVIPKDIRVLFGLKEEVELVITKEGLLIRAPSKNLNK